MIVCIVGPTCVGKTKLSEELACKLDAIIINSDSTQVYREMSIGTAKYTSDEDMGQPHFLFDIKNPDEMYTVYDYQKDCRAILDSHKGKNVVIVGGTGLYLKAALYNYEFQERQTKTYDDLSNEELYAMLESSGEVSDVHINNRRRMISRLNSSGNNNLKDELLYDNVIIVGLTTDRQVLYEKIEKRTDMMMREGLIEEVKSLYDKYGLTKAMRTAIGYKELVCYFRGLTTLEEATNLIKQRCRNYAKRQYTWFNNQMSNIKWFETDYDDFDNTINEVEKYIQSNKKD